MTRVFQFAVASLLLASSFAATQVRAESPERVRQLQRCAVQVNACYDACENRSPSQYRADPHNNCQRRCIALQSSCGG